VNPARAAGHSSDNIAAAGSGQGERFRSTALPSPFDPFIQNGQHDERQNRRCDQPSDGYQVTFAADGDLLNTIVATIDAERKCCPFLQFDLLLPAGEGDAVLTITGPDGTRTFLDMLFNA